MHCQTSPTGLLGSNNLVMMNLGSLDPALGCSGLMSIFSYDSHPVTRSRRGDTRGAGDRGEGDSRRDTGENYFRTVHLFSNVLQRSIYIYIM